MTAINVYAKNNRLSYTKDELDTKTCTLSIVSTPADATIKIDNVITSTKTVDYGTTVNYEVSKNAFATETGTLKICKDTILNVEMVGTEEELDWIQTTGGQYISNIKHTIPANSRLEAKIAYINEVNSTIFYGKNSSSNNNHIAFQVIDSLKRLLLSVKNPSSSSEKDVRSQNYSISKSSTPIVLKYSNLNLYKDNASILGYSEISASDLFEVNTYDLLTNPYTSFQNKFYWLKIYNGNTDQVIHHYVPVLADDVVKMKDLITNEIISFSGNNISGITYGRKSS